MRRVLRIFFDHGHRWPLWESGTAKYAMEPSDFGFSPELAALLARWHRAWEHIADFEIGQTDVPPTAEERQAEADLQRRSIEGIRRELPPGVDLRVEV